MARTTAPQSQSTSSSTIPATAFSSIRPMPRTLATASNLANLLPTSTVLTFRSLSPSFSNKGSCQLSNKYLTASLILFCSTVCFLSSFTDSFMDGQGKLHYGVATLKGLHIFNTEDRNQEEEEILAVETEEKKYICMDLTKFKVSFIDFMHALVSLFVFLVFAFSDSDVQSCFLAKGGAELDALAMNLPLAVGILSAFVFIIFPTTRRGIGHADMPNRCNYILVAA